MKVLYLKTRLREEKNDKLHSELISTTLIDNINEAKKTLHNFVMSEVLSYFKFDDVGKDDEFPNSEITKCESRNNNRDFIFEGWRINKNNEKISVYYEVHIVEEDV